MADTNEDFTEELDLQAVIEALGVLYAAFNAIQDPQDPFCVTINERINELVPQLVEEFEIWIEAELRQQFDTSDT